MRRQVWVVLLCVYLVAVASGCGPASRRARMAAGATPTGSAVSRVATPAGTVVARTAVPASPSAPPATGLDLIRQVALPIEGDEDDYDPLMSLVGDARFVLLGEASHGTHDFYRERARITRRLVEEKGFTAVAIEGEWPEAYRVNRYVRGMSDEPSAEAVLSSFRGFPEWMWNNADVRDLAEWLEQHNEALPANAPQVGFYGLDMYSMEESAEEVVNYFEARDPEAAARARERYRCLSGESTGPTDYDSLAKMASSLCDTSVQEQVEELQQLWESAEKEGYTGNRAVEREELFSALRNAIVVKNKREYDQAAYSGSDPTWNVRDRHMAGTLEALSEHLGTDGKPARVVVWAHNTHVGDATGTEFANIGQLSLGQLVRERHKDDAVLVGFTTYTGTVIAARGWDEQGERYDVRPALPESYSGLFHEAGVGNSLFIVRGEKRLAAALEEPRLQRGIGVVYDPNNERNSHYYLAWLSKQFDAVIHIEESSAVEPLRSAPTTTATP
ncbi:MAG: erythromycin esterase family protein [Chloroflexota bacterium]|nr:erythromycin esterase family protein [Chloroflexota bacterium]